jgi:hypothetical protein
MRLTRAVALAAAIASAGTAIGCGSSGSTHSNSTTTAPATTASTSSAESTSSSSTAAKAGAGGTTAPGTTLALGAPALVDYKPGVKTNSPTYRLQVSVLGIAKGAQADLDGVELEKAQQSKTPYYVKLRVTNVGSGNASAEEGVPAAAFQAIDDRGQQGQELTVLGTFRPCESGTQPKQFTRGVTYQTCEVFLVGGGGSIVKDEWTGSVDAYTEKPIVWNAG